MRLVFVLTALAACAGTVSMVHADIVSPDPYALGGGRVYELQGPGMHYTRPSFFDIFVEELDWRMIGPSHALPPPGVISPGASDADVSAVIVLNGLPPGEPWLGGMHMSFFDIFVEISPTGGLTFDTEMLSMELTGVHNGVPFMIRESPTRPSTGRYAVTPIGGGLYHIDSFFDIFTELSLDGGQTWTPSEGSSHFRIMPSPGAAALLGLGALAAGRRRRA